MSPPPSIWFPDLSAQESGAELECLLQYWGGPAQLQVVARCGFLLPPAFSLSGCPVSLTYHSDRSSNVTAYTPPASPRPQHTHTLSWGELGLDTLSFPLQAFLKQMFSVLLPSCPFAFQHLLGHLGQEREAHRGRYFTGVKSPTTPVYPRPLAQILLSSPSRTPSTSAGNSHVLRVQEESAASEEEGSVVK